MVKKGKTPQDIRQANLELIFKLLREHKALSCSELAVGTGLSNTAVANIIDGLFERGVVVKSTEKPVVTAGRHPVRYVFSPTIYCALFFDFTHETYGLMDFEGGVIFKKDMPPISFWDKAKINEFFVRVKAEVAKQGAEILSVSIALVGKQDRQSGNIVVSRKLAADVNLNSEAEAVFGVSVQIINDTYLLLIAERDKIKSDNIMYLYFGRGISCAFCLGGKLYTGAHDYAGEIGMVAANGQNIEQTLSKDRLKELDNELNSGNDTAFINLTAPAIGFVLNVAKVMDFDDIVIGSPYKHFAQAFVKRLNDAISGERFITPKVSVSQAYSEDYGLLTSALVFLHNRVINRLKG